MKNFQTKFLYFLICGLIVYTLPVQAQTSSNTEYQRYQTKLKDQCMYKINQKESIKHSNIMLDLDKVCKENAKNIIQASKGYESYKPDANSCYFAANTINVWCGSKTAYEYIWWLFSNGSGAIRVPSELFNVRIDKFTRKYKCVNIITEDIIRKSGSEDKKYCATLAERLVDEFLKNE